MKNKKVVITTFESITANSAGGIGKISYSLANYLFQQGVDVCFYSINKGSHKTSFPSKSVHWSSRLFLKLLNLLSRWVGIKPHVKRRIEEWYYDFFLSRKNIVADCILTTNAFIPKTLKGNKRRIPVFYLPPTPNELVIERLCKKELETKGKPNNTYIDAYTYRERIKKFEQSLPYIDRIISISPATTKSYRETTIPIVEIPFIHMPAPRSTDVIIPRESNKVIFLYIAYSVLLKGLHRLLEEWQLAASPYAELHIVGPIAEEYKQAFDLSLLETKGVKFWGYQSDPLPFFIMADVVVIPSLIDNEPSTVTEAIFLGKPVLIAETCGYSRFVGEYVPDAVFDVFDTGSLAKKISAVALNVRYFSDMFKPLVEYIADYQRHYSEFYSKLADNILDKNCLIHT